MHVFEDDVPEVRIVDFQLIVGIIADESALGEGTRTTDKRVLGYSRVVLDDVIDISLEEGFLLTLFIILEEAKDSFLQESLHFILGELVLVGALASFLEMSANEDGLVESELLGGSFEHFSLVSVAGDQSVHLHFALLADPVRSRCGLHVVLRIPIRVIDDDHICAGKVDADSSRLGRQ